ncbi:PAS domain-containing protein [Accumulibacter sp.]|uniref:PAS domain-containing protein n=1 Tax=Accumulibacter sp. TaxID=2053492 RepID=UPI0025ED4787|nr:PAS domain-containing protein [Accumulibacter sp.]MCM8611423.1 PAS domain-containing protein [Accumulibacter sp.]MCM8634930.1 PAS domain-containing protein [Accumulibacter sp.]MCM8638551.1 PAS domain-containing protein [Accumulibacter sp.]
MKRQQHVAHRRTLDQVPFAVASIYGVFAALWLLLSDHAVESVFTGREQIIRVSMFKGWLFVAVTTLLLYLLLRRQVRRIDTAHRKEITMLQERQQSLELLQAIADHSDDAIYAKDTQGRYVLFNGAASRYVGRPPADVLGHDDRDLFPAGQALKLMAIGERIVAGERIETSEECLDTVLGKRTFLATKGPLRDGEGTICGMFGISRDISERKRAADELAEREEMFRSLTSNIPGAVYRCALRPPWRATMMSDGVLPLTGHAARDFLREENPLLWKDLVCAEDLPSVLREVDAAISDDRPFSTIYRIHHAGGEVRWVLDHARPVRGPSGTALHFDGVIFDITDRKQAEDELRERNADLERFNRVTIGRELTLIDMKKRINALSMELGRAPPYPLSFERDDPA